MVMWLRGVTKWVMWLPCLSMWLSSCHDCVRMLDQVFSLEEYLHYITVCMLCSWLSRNKILHSKCSKITTSFHCMVWCGEIEMNTHTHTLPIHNTVVSITSDQGTRSWYWYAEYNNNIIMLNSMDMVMRDYITPFIHMYMHTHTHTCICPPPPPPHTHTHVYAHTHTHTHSLSHAHTHVHMINHVHVYEYCTCSEATIFGYHGNGPSTSTETDHSKTICCFHSLDPHRLHSHTATAAHSLGVKETNPASCHTHQSQVGLGKSKREWWSPERGSRSLQQTKAFQLFKKQALEKSERVSHRVPYHSAWLYM